MYDVKISYNNVGWLRYSWILVFFSHVFRSFANRSNLDPNHYSTIFPNQGLVEMSKEVKKLSLKICHVFCYVPKRGCFFTSPC